MPYVRKRRRRRRPTLDQKLRDWFKARPWLPVLAITLVAAILRLSGLDTQSLSHDELSTWARTEHNGLKGLLEYGVRTDLHPPGHFLLIWAIKNLGFDSAIAMRLPSAIASTLAVPLLYRIGKHLFDHTIGALAAGIMAVSWCMVFYAQDARAYALMLFTGLLALDATLRLVEGLRRDGVTATGTWVQLILAGIATAYLHYYGLFIMGLLGFGACLSVAPRVRSTIAIAAGFATIGLSYLPWLEPFLEDLGRTSSWMSQQGVAFFPQWWRWIFGDALTPAIAAAGLVLAGAMAALSRWRTGEDLGDWRRVAALIGWLAMPGFIAFIKSLLSTPALTFKNLLLCAPAAYLLVALCVARLPIRPWIRHGLGAALIGLMLLDLLGFKGYLHTPHKRQYREVVAAALEGEPPTLIAACGIPAHFNYYLRRSSEQQVDFDLCKIAQIPKLVAAIETKPNGSIVMMWAHYRPDDGVRAFLDERFTVESDHIVLGARVLRLRWKTSADPKLVPPDKPPLTRGDCGPRSSEHSDWLVWSRDTPIPVLEMSGDTIQVSSDWDTVSKVDVCLKQRLNIQGTVQIDGEWAANIEQGHFAQLSLRFFGADGKWVKGEGAERPLRMIRTTKASQSWQSIQRTMKPPSAATSAQICLEFKGQKGTVMAQGLCLSSE